VDDENPYTDRPRTADSPTEAVYEDDAAYPYARNYWPSGWPSWVPWGEREADDPVRGDDRPDPDTTGTGQPPGTENEWGRLGILVAVVGIGLVVFPEPATSMVGAVLAVVGVLAWLVDRFE
jgi:hypothetical protein